MNNSSDLLDHDCFLVFGAARSGLAAARLLKSLGKRVAIYDEAPAEYLNEAKAEADAMDVRLLRSLDDAHFPNGWEVLVLSPGIPPTHPLVVCAEECGCVVRSEVEIGYLACEAPIVAITGTNGKTTVTHLLTHLLHAADVPAVMGGNVGRALCDAVRDPEARKPGARIVCEISSYQLESIERFLPNVACVLNITPDHLERYGTMGQYMEAKYRITENQQSEDVLVVNADDHMCLSFGARTHAATWTFSTRAPVSQGAWLENGQIRLRTSPRGKVDFVMERDAIPLPGMHNVENVLAAIAMGAALGLEAQVMGEAVQTFRSVPHRIEPVAEMDGVRYYNDSKATNLDSMCKALASFEAPEPRIVLIAGGRDKGAPWTEMNEMVRCTVRGLVLIGEARPIGRAAWGEVVPEVREADGMEEAVDLARTLARPGDVVVLSPGCASFDMYRNFEERGNDFKRVVAEIEGAYHVTGGSEHVSA